MACTVASTVTIAGGRQDRNVLCAVGESGAQFIKTCHRIRKLLKVHVLQVRDPDQLFFTCTAPRLLLEHGSGGYTQFWSHILFSSCYCWMIFSLFSSRLVLSCAMSDAQEVSYGDSVFEETCIRHFSQNNALPWQSQNSLVLTSCFACCVHVLAEMKAISQGDQRRTY